MLDFILTEKGQKFMYQINPSVGAELPTMYDLPSEIVGEPGLPDEFHLIQSDLLRLTFKPPAYPEERFFSACDLNLYYDLNHPQWYKRPDWFGVIGISRLYQEQDLRLSYVIWQEKVSPLVAVELLSPGTEAEDLGKTLWEVNQPPTKWIVYEQILRIPYYFVFNRYTNEFKAFGLREKRYQPLPIENLGVWLEEAQIGLGLWQGNYQGLERLWIRWYDKNNHWIPTPEEREKQRAETEKQRAETERQRAETEKQRAETERQRAVKAELENAKLRELLRQAGLQIPE